jgi:choice-of-anchor B domain-containing protein
MKLSTFFLSFFLVATNLVQGQGLNMSLLSTWIGTSVPNNPVGFKYSDIWGWKNTVTNKEYAIIGSSTKIHFVDVTNPATPVEVAYHLGESNTAWREFRTFGNYLYAITEPGGSVYEGLKVFNLATQLPTTTPASPIAIEEVNTNQFTHFSSAHMLFVDETSQKLYVSGTNTRSNGLILLDLSATPDNPTMWRSDVLSGGYVHDLFIKNKIVFANHLSNGVATYNYDISQSAPAPAAMDTYLNTFGSNVSHSGWITESGAYIMCDEAHNNAVKSLTSDPNNLTLLDTFYSNLAPTPTLQSIAHNPYGIGNLVFISYYHDGILVYDATNPSDIVKVGHFDTEPTNTNYSGYAGAWGVFPFLPSGNIIASDVNLGLKVIKLNSQCGPPSLMTLGTPTNNSIALDWNDRPSTSNYKVRYRLATGGAWTELTVPATSSDLTMFGLAANTAYIVQVSSQCPYGFSEYAKQYAFTTAAALPIELTTFEAKNKANGIFLTWKTANETDFSHFELEHSTDGIEFLKLGNITNKGNEITGANYSFLDEKPALNANFYRLKSIDFSDKFEYSNIIKTNWNVGKLPMVAQFYANKNDLQIQLVNCQDQTVQVAIVDVLGRVMLHKKITTNDVNEFTITENLSNIIGAAQIFFTSIKFENGREFVYKSNGL